MSITEGTEFADTLGNSYIAGSISVGTTAVEAKVGATRSESREVVRIYNNSNTTIYFGPSDVTASTGEPIFKNQWINIPVNVNLSVYLITASGTASDIRIQEIG